MTVKCLTGLQKAQILKHYQAKEYDQKTLAMLYDTSARTINRVLIEAGVATPVERIKGDAYQVMQLLKEHAVDIPTLKDLLAIHKMQQDFAVKHQNDVSMVKPWYPDDSGNWIEVPNEVMEPPNIPESTKIHVMLLDARISRSYSCVHGAVSHFNWACSPMDQFRIVAYKVAK